MSIKPGNYTKVWPLGILDLYAVFHVCGLGIFTILLFHKNG